MHTALRNLEASCSDVLDSFLASNLALRTEIVDLRTRLNHAEEDRATLRENLNALRETVTSLQNNQVAEISKLKSQCDDLARVNAGLQTELTQTKSEHSSSLDDIRSKLETALTRIANAQHAFEQATGALTDLCKGLKAPGDHASDAVTGTIVTAEKAKEST